MLVVVAVFLSSKAGAERERTERSKETGQSDDQTAPQNQKLLTRGLVFLLLTRAGLSYSGGALLAFLPLFAVQALGFSTTEVGLILALNGIASVISRPLGDRLAPKMGQRNLLLLAIGLGACSLLVLTLLPFRELVWLATPLWGLGGGMFGPMSFVQVIDEVPRERRTQGLGLLTLMLDVGNGIGAAGSAFLLLYSGYPLVFGVAFLVAIVVFGAQLRHPDGIAESTRT